MIVYACPDLMFATKIRATAEAADVGSRPVRDTTALSQRLGQVDDGKLHEPVTGVIVDLDMGQIALDLIRLARGHDRALPIVAYGPHVDIEALAAARQAGADFVLPRGQFASNLPDIVARLGQAHV